ncbi:hypothetical protein BGZ90_004143, partial [Linnemannia elongata]
YDQQAALFTAAKTHFGRVDIIANNAGIAENAPLWEDEKGVWKKVIDIDLSAVVEGTRLGIEALYPQPRTPVYSAAKFGVVGFTRSFKDFGDNIRVNAVAPSFAPTKIIEPIKEVVTQMGALVTVEMVTDAFMLLIEDDSYSGDIARVTPQYGISVLGKTVAADKKKKAKL